MSYKKNFPNKKNKQSVCLVIQDSSQSLPKQNFDPKQIQRDEIDQRPIRQRIALQKSQQMQNYQPVMAKKIKFYQQIQSQSIPIIRFNTSKGQSFDQNDLQGRKINQKKKLKRAVPWMSKKTSEIEDANLRLHNQIVEFYHYIKPTKKEHQQRKNVFNLVKNMIFQKYPQSQIQYFGSFSTELYLPDGDIDITVLINDINDYEERKVYETIHKIIRRHQGSTFCDIQYIRSSKVPLIKFVHVDTQFQFDISVNKLDGINQVQHVQRMIKMYPQFQPMVFVFKTMLKVRNMSQTYSGGIGSFLLFCLILHFLRSVHRKEHYYTMGQYVLKFMEFYGILGDWDRKSIYVSDSSQVSRARQQGTISFYSPQDQSHDIGKSAWKVRDSLNVFKNRFRTITGKNFSPGQSILKQLVNPSLQEFRYYRYEKQHNKKAEQ